MATAKKYPEVRAEMPAKSLSAIKAGFPPATKALERVPSSSKCRNNSALLDEKIQAVSGELAKGLLFAKAAKAREGKKGALSSRGGFPYELLDSFNEPGVFSCPLQVIAQLFNIHFFAHNPWKGDGI